MSTQPDAASHTHERILDATLAALSKHGLQRLSLEDVAREAGVSRQTVYRYFGSKDALITACILREEAGFIERVTAAAREHAELRPALEAAMVAMLTAAREHPLLDRLLETEPEALLPFLTTGAGPVLSAARPALSELLTRRLPHLSEQTVHRLADLVTRLFISYAINPPEDSVAELAAGLTDLLLEGVKEPPSDVV